MLTSEIHQHLKHRAFTQGAYSKVLLFNAFYEKENDILPQFNANPWVQQSCFQIFLWSKASYAYFTDEKTETWINDEERRN